MWNSVRVKQYATAFSVAACFIVLVDSQWPNYDVIKTRLPGKCARGEFDCIIGPCVPSYKFNDGHSDCLDGSDEFCFAGQIRCGKYCVHISFAGECLANPNCDGSPSAPSFCESTKTKLCDRADVMRCKGFNECVLRKWVLDDNDDCLDASDSDIEYVTLMNGIYYDHFVTPSPQLWTLLPLRPKTEGPAIRPTVWTEPPPKTHVTIATVLSTTTNNGLTSVSSTASQEPSTYSTPEPNAIPTSTASFRFSSSGTLFSFPNQENTASSRPGSTSVTLTTTVLSLNRNSTCYENATSHATARFPHVRCSCPPGQERSRNGTCETAHIATFTARVFEICNGTNVKADDEPSLLVEKLSDALGEPVCVRRFGYPLILNTVCNKCNLSDLAALVSHHGFNDYSVKVRLSEVEAGGCYEFDINDCDEKAQCLPEGLHYKCLCLPGTNDTTDGSGRHCDGVVIATSCHQFLGVCILFWILLLLLLLLLIPAIYMAYQYCTKKRAAVKKRAVQHRVIEVRPLSPSKRISIDSTAVITTTTASTTLPLPTATAGSSSAQQKPFPLSWKRPIPETVITVPSTSSKDYEIIEDVESVTSSEPEVVSLRSSKSVESLQILNVPSNVPATLPLPFPNLITETVIPVEIHNERRSSTRSEGVPTMWESFKILGKHYTGGDSTKSRASSTTSLDSLIRRSELVQVVQPRLSTVNRSSFPEVFHFTSMASHPNTTKIVPSQEAYPNPTELPAEIPPAAQEAVQSRRASSVVEDEGHMKLAAMLGMDVHDSSQSSLESTLPLKPFAHLSETQSEHPQESSKVLPVEDPASEVAVPLATQIQTLPTAEEIINMAAENIAFKATTEAIEDSVGRTSTQIPAARSREQSRSPETRRESKVSLEETKKPLKFGQPEKKVKPKVREEKLKKSPAARRKTEGTPTSSTTSKNLELESPLVVRRPVSLRRPLPPDQPQLEAKARPKKPELPSIRRPHLPQKPPSKPAKLNQRLERIEESDSMTTDGEMGPGRFKKEQKGLKLADKTRFPTLHEPITKPDVKPEKKSVPPKLPRKLPDKVFPPCDDYQKPKMHRQWQTTSDTSSHGDLVTSDAEISEDLKLVLRKVELKEETPKRAARNGVRERSRRARKYSSTEALSDSSPPQFRLPTSCPQTARVRRDQHYKSKDNLYKSRLPVRQNKIEESLRKFNCTAMNDDFIGADIDIDLPGPFTIPVDFSDLKRHRPRFGSHSSLHKSAIPRPVKLFSSEHDIRTVVSTADRRYVSNLARKIANRKKQESQLPPLSITTSARTPVLFYRDWGSPVSSRKSVKSCCADFYDRPRWDTSPLREGELERIPLNFALPPSHRLPPLTPSKRPKTEHLSRRILCEDCQNRESIDEQEPIRRTQSLTSLFRRSEGSKSVSKYWNYEVKRLREHHWWSDE